MHRHHATGRMGRAAGPLSWPQSSARHRASSPSHSLHGRVVQASTLLLALPACVHACMRRSQSEVGVGRASKHSESGQRRVKAEGAARRARRMRPQSLAPRQLVLDGCSNHTRGLDGRGGPGGGESGHGVGGDKLEPDGASAHQTACCVLPGRPKARGPVWNAGMRRSSASRRTCAALRHTTHARQPTTRLPARPMAAPSPPQVRIQARERAHASRCAWCRTHAHRRAAMGAQVGRTMSGAQRRGAPGRPPRRPAQCHHALRRQHLHFTRRRQAV